MLTRGIQRVWVSRGGRRLTTSHASPQEKRIYVIAGEASGDAIGAKVIAALQRKVQTNGDRTRLVVRGIGGSQMTACGGFASLFPMDELSIMGLVEVLPSVLRLRRRLTETLDDMRAFQPHVLLTIDSKGFTFRVQRALESDLQLRHAVSRMHYVAPSMWAYKHRQRKTDFTDLKTVLDKMFVILPFEEPLFNGGGSAAETGHDWCTFVGHPAVEDFLEFHGVYDSESWPAREQVREKDGEVSLKISEGGLLRGLELDPHSLSQRGRLTATLMKRGRDDLYAREAFRNERGLTPNAFVVCALVGSRENEVRRTIRTVLEAVDALQRPAEQIVKTSMGIPMKLTPLHSAGGCVVKRPIHVIFPTITAVEAIVRHEIDAFCNASGVSAEQFQITVDANFSKRYELFQSADAAVAVSGTIVMETTLAALPTIVIYRANRLTEILAKLLSAVQYVSIPNLLLGREEIPELLFRDCTAPGISKALRSIYTTPKALVESRSPSQVAMALSTLVPWENAARGGCEEIPKPVRGSEMVAELIWRALMKK